MTLDMKGLEHAIVRHCSPTLAGIKPGCLFNVPGAFVADPNEEPAARLAAWREAKQRCHALDALVAQANEALTPRGVHVRVVSRGERGALVYVYRPALLGMQLREGRVAAKLSEWGYRTEGAGWLELSLSRLSRRLEAKGRSGQAFPHEVGFFLGYPYEDVMGFIEHEGRDYLCCGCWKVYANQRRAEASFARYRSCTCAFERLLEQGVAIAELAGRGANYMQIQTRNAGWQRKEAS